VRFDVFALTETEKLWVNVILKFLDDLYPPVRVFDVSPVSVGDHYYRVRSVATEL
jgi:hypothetical protein